MWLFTSSKNTVRLPLPRASQAMGSMLPTSGMKLLSSTLSL